MLALTWQLYVPPPPAAGVPAIVAVDPALVNVSPLGSGHEVAEMVAPGTPAAVIVKDPALPTLKVAAVGPVNAGGAWAVMVRVCLTAL